MSLFGNGKCDSNQFAVCIQKYVVYRMLGRPGKPLTMSMEIHKLVGKNDQEVEM